MLLDCLRNILRYTLMEQLQFGVGPVKSHAALMSGDEIYSIVGFSNDSIHSAAHAFMNGFRQQIKAMSCAGSPGDMWKPADNIEHLAIVLLVRRIVPGGIVKSTGPIAT